MSSDERLILTPRDQRIHDAVSSELNITDAQLQLLSAIDKVKLIKALVQRAVENMIGLNLTWDEKVIVIEYREWRDSPQSVSGVFHVRVPKAADISRIAKQLAAESAHNKAQIDQANSARPTCAQCGQPIAPGDYKMTDDYGDSFHALCVDAHVAANSQDPPADPEPDTAA
jgi:hypothetical protein